MLVVALAACEAPSSVGTATDPLPVPGTSTAPRCPARSGPEVRLPASPDVRLARVLHLELDVPAKVVLDLDGTAVARFPAATVHDLPLLGLRAGELHAATVTVRCDAGEDVLGPVEVDPGPPPAAWPDVQILADDPDRRSPGATLFDLWTGVGGLAAVDADGVPVWALGTPERPLAATLEPDGTVWIVSDGLIRRVDLLGDELVRYAPAADAGPGDVPVDVATFHHEVRPVPGGFLALDYGTVAVDAYPTSEQDPEVVAPAVVLDTVVVEVADDGTLLRRFALSERLDTGRIGWNGLEPTDAGYDWSHGNAVAVDPADGDLVVSVRNQDAVLKLDRETGDVRWILSVPDGWRAPWDALRLAPETGLTWPYHQHAARITATGGLLMFDNGNADRTTPYAGVNDGAGFFSRLVEYRVDEAAGTVAEVWSAAETSTGPQFSGAFGDADLLANGDRLGVWGYLFKEDGVRNADRGRGDNSVRLVELAPDGDVVWEASLSSRRSDFPGGWQTHRVQRVESWYPAFPVD